MDEKKSAGAIRETEFLNPKTMYGCNKLYCEQLGSYFSQTFQQLTATFSPNQNNLIDFRSIRFPGLISAVTMPTGGTSDFIPEIIHNAVLGNSYDCFVNPETKMPFMTMPDAIEAILKLMDCCKEDLSRRVYHITSFSKSAAEFKEKTLSYFPKSKIGFKINSSRQKIVNSWPLDVDDSAAKNDWNWKALYDFDSAFSEYLIPGLESFYKNKGNKC